MLTCFRNRKQNLLEWTETKERCESSQQHSWSPRRRSWSSGQSSWALEAFSKFIFLGKLCGMLFQELGESLHRSVSTLKFDGLLFAVTRREVYGGESLYFEAVVGHVVGCGVHLGYDQIVLPFILLSQSRIVGLQLLTVATPGSVKLNQDIFVGIHDDLIKGLSNHDFNGSFVVLWYWLGLDDGLEFTWKTPDFKPSVTDHVSCKRNCTFPSIPDRENFLKVCSVSIQNSKNDSPWGILDL